MDRLCRTFGHHGDFSERTLNELLLSPDDIRTSTTAYPEESLDPFTPIQSPDLSHGIYETGDGRMVLAFSRETLRIHRLASKQRNRICNRHGLPQLFATVNDPASLGRLTYRTHRLINKSSSPGPTPLSYSRTADRSAAVILYDSQPITTGKHGTWSTYDEFILRDAFKRIHPANTTYGSTLTAAREIPDHQRVTLLGTPFPAVSCSLFRDGAQQVNSTLSDATLDRIHDLAVGIDHCSVAMATTPTTGVWSSIEPLKEPLTERDLPIEDIIMATADIVGAEQWVPRRLLSGIAQNELSNTEADNSADPEPIDYPSDLDHEFEVG